MESYILLIRCLKGISLNEMFGPGYLECIFVICMFMIWRYRYEFKSQQLWTEIKFVLNNFAKPFTDLLNVILIANEMSPYISEMVNDVLIYL